jgi:hypothetical protein
MSNQRTHYVTTSDGVTLGGTVHGDGPPLVFLQGVIGDGDLDWGSTVGHLTDNSPATCRACEAVASAETIPTSAARGWLRTSSPTSTASGNRPD